MSAVVLFAVVGLAILAATILLDLATRPGPGPRAAAPHLLAALGAGLLAVAGAIGLAGGTRTAGVGWLLGDLGGGLVLDRLAALFLLITCAVAVPACLIAASWAHGRPQPPGRGLGAATALTVFACGVVVLAGNVFLLVLGWELLTAGFYWLAGHERSRAGRTNASLATVVFGKTSGAALLLGLLLLAGSAGTLDLDDLAGAGSGPARSAAYVLLVIAFAVKVGLAPVQLWMPAGYAAAPGPLRAVMAGAAVNVGFYGLWRTLDVLGAPPAWLPVVLLLLGGFTAILGIAHATVQTRLTRVIAYSSVENAGLIVTAYAVALVGATIDEPRLVAVGLLAATLQVIAHAIAKTLLFASVGIIESRLDTDNLDELRGVARRLPWSGTGLAVGAFTLAGLPPTVAFVSEWFILESLMQQFRLDSLPYALAMAAGGALVALTAGFAGVAFARISAFTVLGPTRPGSTDGSVRDVGITGRLGLVVLAAACPVVAALTPLEIRLIAAGLDSLVPAATLHQAVPTPWVLGPVYQDFSVLSPSWLALELPAMALLVLGLAALLSRGGFFRIRRVPAWRSATGGVDGADEYTPFGYAHPTRRVLANVLRTRSELTIHRAADDTNGDRPTHQAPRVGYTADVVELVGATLYRPLLRPLRALVAAARRLQSGRLDAYLSYMLLTLVALIAIVAAVQ